MRTPPWRRLPDDSALSEPLWSAFLATAKHLTSYAVKFRYPGHVVTDADVKHALADCRSIRTEVRASLGLPKKR